MLVRMLTVGDLGTNCYLVGCQETHQGIVIDPGGDAELILAEVQRLGLRIVQIINTHGHFDHTLANRQVKETTGAPLAIHAADAEMLTNPLKSFSIWAGNLKPGPAPDALLKDGDVVRFGREELKVLHTPGHSPGSISLSFNPPGGSEPPGGSTKPPGGSRVVFTGDALFQGSIGRTDFPGGNYDQLIRSITTRLLVLPDDTLAYTGHGPATTIGDERRDNPFLQ